jgi:glucoamylase
MITVDRPPFSPEEKTVIENNLLKNIATADNKLVKITGDKILTALPGAVIAAPALPSETFSQDYYFYWVRDGAITIHELLCSYQQETVAERKTLLKNCCLDYLNFVKTVQMQPALNGVDILGEPKFNIDGTLWTGQWSRPQPDGAAYQSITLTLLAQILLDEGQKDFVLANIYDPSTTNSLLKANLEYTAANWSSMSIGPWEELLGFHFSVETIQRRALIDGAALATRLNDRGAATYYLEQAERISDLMKAHWNESVGYYFELFRGQDIRGGGINAAIIFALVYGQLNIKDDPFPLVCEHALSSAFYVRDIFNNLYQLNALNKEKENLGPLIGRYQSDLYDGNRMAYGNPWFLCSNMLAAFYYRVAAEFLNGKELVLSFLTKQFFDQIAPDFKVSIGQTVGKAMKDFEGLISALIHQGDLILNTVKACCIDAADGTRFHMSEQINRASGAQVSAPDLSWSYASLLTSLRLRDAAVGLI